MTQVEEFTTVVDSLNGTMNKSLEIERNAYLGCIAHSLAIIADTLKGQEKEKKCRNYIW